MRIGFICPSSHYLYDPFRGDPHTHFQILTIIEDRFEHRVELLLIDLRGIDLKMAIYHIPECDLYLHSVYTLDYNEQRDIVTNVRRHYPKALHVAGGPHVSVYQEEAQTFFDAIVLGDGEESIITIVETLFAAKPLQKVYRMPRAIEDLGVLPFPRRHYLPKTATARRNMMNLQGNKESAKLLGSTAIFSRGCPSKCSFCAMPSSRARGGVPPIRYRPAHHVAAEIEYLKQEFNIQGLNLLDEIGIPLIPQLAREYLEAIGKTGIVWRGQCRVDGITPETAHLARASGCTAMGLGIESVSERSLELIRKQISLEQARRTIALLNENNIESRLYMIIGLPGEPEDILEQTWRFIQETQPGLVILSLFTVRPGTDVFDNPTKYGIEYIDHDSTKSMHMFGRYDNEQPTLTFRYAKTAPWGKTLSNEEIVSNYLELQQRLKNCGLSALPYYNERDLLGGG
ncbi:MAG: B12-binding domain-containing radical SAM protein [Magnetococcus sp. YQC-5]